MSRFKTLSTENTEMPGQSYIPTHQLFSSLFCDDKESGKWSISHEIDEAMLSSSMCLFNILYYDRNSSLNLLGPAYRPIWAYLKTPNRNILWFGGVWVPLLHTWYLSRTPRICSCKFFLVGVNFYRFNAKNWHFRQILREKVAFFYRFNAKNWRFSV